MHKVFMETISWIELGKSSQNKQTNKQTQTLEIHFTYEKLIQFSSVVKLFQKVSMKVNSVGYIFLV